MGLTTCHGATLLFVDLAQISRDAKLKDTKGGVIMKVVVGIDHSQASERAAILASRFGFRDSRLHFVNVVGDLGTLGFATEIPPAPDLLDRLIREQMDASRRRLEECREIVHNTVTSIDITSEIRRGNIVNEILSAANNEGAELIAVGSGTTSLEAMMIGSVSRKLVTSSPYSVLIAKNRPLSPGRLRVVLAADHSPYFKRCLQELIRLAPQGIGELTIVSAYPRQLVDIMRSVVEHFRADVDAWIEKSIADENQKLASDLEVLHCNIATRVIGRTPEVAILNTAVETDADVIVLGAQGHGFMDRLLTGSVSHRVSLETDRHVLILRSP